MILGLLVPLIGTWILIRARTEKRMYRNEKRIYQKLNAGLLEEEARLKAALEELKKQDNRFSAHLDDIQQTRAFEQQLVQDAVNRELRAKASLRAVLTTMECTDAHIESVISAIDGRESGDL